MVRYPEPTKVEGGAAVFADAHLGQVASDADDLLDALSDLPKKGISTVVLLGDIFHYFIGDAKFETPLVRRVLQGFSTLAASGLSLRYVEGNRDFFVSGTRFAAPFSSYRLADGLEVGGTRYAFVHGDRVNTADLPYRFWRVVSKNPVAHGVLKTIPGRLARRIVSKAEARLYRSNFRHKRHLPEQALLLEARAARRAGYDAVVVGHFHVDRTLETPQGTARVLPAWLEERKHAEIAADGVLTIVQEASAGRASRRGFGAIEEVKAAGTGRRA